MLQTKITTAVRSHVFTAAPVSMPSVVSPASPANAFPEHRLKLVPASGPARPIDQPRRPAYLDLLAVAANRCAAFFAEAAVLVLVFGLLDRFILKGRIELGWFGGAFSIALVLLLASIAIDFAAKRWLRITPTHS